MVRHLYVHVPYCHRICPYCSFHKHTPGRADFGRFVGALLGELRDEVGRLGNGVRLETIYFGGGTPTLLPRAILGELLAGVGEVAGAGVPVEWTVEANPRTVGAAKAEVMLEAGVTRLSLGVQSWNAKTLGILGRDHTPEEAEEIYRVVRGAGFRNVSVDLMFGVPGQDAGVWRESLERTLALEPEHISAYNLTYEEDTEFMAKFESGEYGQDADEDADLYGQALEVLGGAGYRHYEVSNYARPGFESVHNRGYWRGEEYLGIGPSAVSTVGRRRWKNVANTDHYVETVLGEGGIPREVEELTEEALRLEGLALGLRTDEGVEVELLGGGKEVEAVSEAGFLEYVGGRVRLTEAGRRVADEVVGYVA